MSNSASIVTSAPAPQSVDQRTILFISHATTEDDEFAKWLAAQLVLAGYAVWCDKTKLLGGEKFWNDIKDAIENASFRFLFVSTLAGNTKGGTIRELNIALATQQRLGIKDFVVPLKIDAYPFEAMRPEVRNLNCVRFDQNWAAGLAQLLNLLEREHAPKSGLAGATCVYEWYRRSIEARRLHLVQDETCHSNWFRIRFPRYLWLHNYQGPTKALEQLSPALGRSYRVVGTTLITFCALPEVQERLGPEALFSGSRKVETDQFYSRGDDKLSILFLDAFNIVSDLTRQAWDRALDARKLSTFKLASGLTARFFTNGHLEKNRAYYFKAKGKRAFRQVVGHKSKRIADGQKVPDGFWHYALSASPQLTPFPRIVLRHHVIFTDDGHTPWDAPDRMLKARRSVCKNWWNREWRDRLFAFCAELADTRGGLDMPVSDTQRIRVSMTPLSFVSPWTYYEDKDDGLDEGKEIELVEDETPEDDEAP